MILHRGLLRYGYRGPLRAITRQIPNPRLVEREISLAFPKLEFDLYVLDAD